MRRDSVSSPPLISVVIPMYNASEFIRETLSSVLCQHVEDLEVIVVDDGSTDNSAAIVEQIRASASRPIRLVRQDNSGVAAARNQGVAHAKGDYVAFLDADDLWDPRKLTLQLQVLLDRPELIGVMCGYAPFDSDSGRELRVIHPQWNDRYARRWISLSGPGPLLPSTLLLRRSAWTSSGEFDVRLSTAADADFGYRLLRQGKIDVVNQALVRYRLSANQMHKDSSVLVHDYAILVNKPVLRGDPKLRKQTRANLSLHLKYRALRQRPSLRAMTELLAAIIAHPLAAMRRGFRHMIKSRSGS